MAAEARETIMALLEIEPQTASIIRKLEFLERDLARLEALPAAPATGNHLVIYITFIIIVIKLFKICE